MIEEGRPFVIDPPRRARAGLLAAVLVLLAFLAGLLAAGVAVRRSDRVARLLRPAAAAAVATPAVPAPAPMAAPPPDATTNARVDALERRIDAIDSRATEASGDADRAEGLLVAFAARRVLDRGQALGFLEGLLRAHFGAVEPAAVATVIGAAQRPVTLAALRDRFDALAPALVAPPAREGWWQGLRRELGGLLVVRRAGTPSAVPGDRQARAAHALELGQVDVALTEVARMPGAPAAAEWMAAARRYVVARGALDRIETAALLKPSPAPATQDAGDAAAATVPAPPATAADRGP